MSIERVLGSGSDKPKHTINKQNLWVRETGGADRSVRKDHEMHEGDSLLTVVVFQQLLSRSNRAPFGHAGRLAQWFFQPDDLP
jgi:hypothetical protein